MDIGDELSSTSILIGFPKSINIRHTAVSGRGLFYCSDAAGKCPGNFCSNLAAPSTILITGVII
jgi:hypothetical protein